MSNTITRSNYSLEAVWLAAIAIATLLMNSYGVRSFEATRVIFLQPLAVFTAVIIAAAALRSKQRSHYLKSIKSPVVLAVLLLFLSYILSTWLSTSPQTSLWGGYDWGQGLLTQASCVVFFFAMFFGLKTHGQANRIISMYILAGFGVALYGMVQYFDSDPLAWQVTWNNIDFTRVASTLGNPMYTGAFLTCIIPLCLARLGFYIRQQDTGWKISMGPIQSLVLLLAFLAVWMIHPFLPVGLYVLVAGYYSYRLKGDESRRCLQISTLIFILSTTLWALLLTQSRGALLGLLLGLGLFFLMYLAVFTEASSKARRYSGIFFLLITIVSGIFFISIQMGDEGSRILRLESRSTEMRVLMWEGAWDVWDREPERKLFGHGPDMTALSFEASYPAALMNYEGGARIGKAHNLFYETAIARGGFGVLSLLVFFLVLWTACLRNLGILATRKSMWIFALLVPFTGSLIAMLALQFGSLSLLAPVFSLGCIVAVAGYLIFYLWFSRKKAEPLNSEHKGMTWNGLGISSAVFALFAVLQSGIAFSFEYIFLFSAAAIMARGSKGLSSEKAKDNRSDGAVIALICIILGSGLLQGTEYQMVAWWVIVVTAGIALIHFDFIKAPKSVVTKTAIVGVLLLVLVAFVPKALLANDQTSLATGLPIIFSLICWLVFYSWREGASKGPAIAACAAFCLVVWSSHFPILQADIAEQKGKLAMAKGNMMEAAEILKRAIDLQPKRDRYSLLLSGAYLSHARSRVSIIEKDSLIKLAEIQNKRALNLAPLDGDHLLNRARLFSAWAQVSPDSSKKKERWAGSIEHYSNYLPMRPEDYRIHKELAFTQESAGRTKDAVESYSKSVELEPKYIDGHIGLARTLESISDSSGVFRAFENVLQNNVYDVPLFFQLAQALDLAGGANRAIARIRKDNADLTREEHAFLSLLYWKENDCVRARQNLGKALEGGLADPKFRDFAKALTISCDASKSL